jgi:enamine deaminase RidA (YjgF/YER057c/UK114 family)
MLGIVRGTMLPAALAILLCGPAGAQQFERQAIDPPGIFKHPAFTRVVTVKGPMKLVFVAGQTPSDQDYKPVAPGDYRAQLIKVMENLDVQLKAAGATWDDVVYRRIFVLDVDKYLVAARDPSIPKFGSFDRPPSTLIGVTRLSNPEFLIEIDLLAIVRG